MMVRGDGTKQTRSQERRCASLLRSRCLPRLGEAPIEGRLTLERRLARLGFGMDAAGWRPLRRQPDGTARSLAGDGDCRARPRPGLAGPEGGSGWPPAGPRGASTISSWHSNGHGCASRQTGDRDRGHDRRVAEAGALGGPRAGGAAAVCAVDWLLVGLASGLGFQAFEELARRTIVSSVMGFQYFFVDETSWHAPIQRPRSTYGEGIGFECG